MKHLGWRAAAACALLLSAALARPAAASALCATGATYDTLQKLPGTLVGEAKSAFGLNMPDSMVEKTTVLRCMEGRAYMCNMGANLPCGKANLSRSSQGAADYCRENPNSDMVPAFATGHDTVYTWRCVDGVAMAGKPMQRVDPRGFLAAYWKAAE